MKNPFGKKAAKAEPAGKKQDTKPEPPPAIDPVMVDVDAIISAAIATVYAKYGIAILRTDVAWTFQASGIPKGSGLSVSHEFMKTIQPPKPTP